MNSTKFYRSAFSKGNLFAYSQAGLYVRVNRLVQRVVVKDKCCWLEYSVNGSTFQPYDSPYLYTEVGGGMKPLEFDENLVGRGYYLSCEYLSGGRERFNISSINSATLEAQWVDGHWFVGLDGVAEYKLCPPSGHYDSERHCDSNGVWTCDTYTFTYKCEDLCHHRLESTAKLYATCVVEGTSRKSLAEMLEVPCEVRTELTRLLGSVYDICEKNGVSIVMDSENGVLRFINEKLEGWAVCGDCYDDVDPCSDTCFRVPDGAMFTPIPSGTFKTKVHTMDENYGPHVYKSEEASDDSH